MGIPLLRLGPAYEELAVELDQAYHRVMTSGRYLLGPELEAFECEYATWVGAKYCIGVGNGLEALQLALIAMGVRQGDQVIVPSNGYIATWLAVSHVGAEPVPCEPNEETHNLDPDRVAALIGAKTKAILPIHLYGLPAPVDELVKAGSRFQVPVLEDAAQSHGAKLNGRHCGSLGLAAGVSFYPSKNLGAFADAGAVTTSDDQVADGIRLLRNYGSRQRYYNEVIGFNSRLDELQAAFLRVRLRYLEGWNDRRRKLAQLYLDGLGGIGDLVLPKLPPGAESAWHLFVVRTSRRDELKSFLASRSIGTEIHYPVPPHLSVAYKSTGWKRGDFPVAERLASEVISLPIGPHCPESEAEVVVEAIAEFFSK